MVVAKKKKKEMKQAEFEIGRMTPSAWKEILAQEIT